MQGFLSDSLFRKINYVNYQEIEKVSTHNGITAVTLVFRQKTFVVSNLQKTQKVSTHNGTESPPLTRGKGYSVP